MMDLKSGYPFWAIKNGLLRAFPRIEANADCDVLVVGGGISGALIADELVKHGHRVIVVEQRDIGWGSTAASTALLQYEIDTPLTELSAEIGEAQAVLAYRSCVDAIGALRGLARSLGPIDFRMQDSLYLASSRWHLRSLRAEHALRARHGLPVEWLDQGAVRSRYGIDAPGAILSRVAAAVDPYRMTYRLLGRVARQGGRVFDRTSIRQIDPHRRGVDAHTDDGLVIRATHLVMAAGYASQQWLKQRLARNRSSYALVSDPVAQDRLGFLSRTLVWETARPYLYMRSTGDGRVMVGGEDDAVDVPSLRDARVDGKQRRLLEKFEHRIPGLGLRPAFAWGGTFAETHDGLPFFGSHAQYGRRVLFAMAYGGNGITYSQLGAGLVRALVERRKHPLARLFSFERID